VVTVRAGTPLAELEAALAEQGQCLPFEPPRFAAEGGTVGGMVAAGLAGPARAAWAACATTCSAPRCSTAAARC
jgi:glycolate oxidase FAD binding subunit